MTNGKEFQCLTAQENDTERSFSHMKRMRSVLRSSMDFILIYFSTKILLLSFKFEKYSFSNFWDFCVFKSHIWMQS